MRIAVIIPSLVVAGAENMVTQLVTNININKYDVRVLVLYKPQNTHLERLLHESGISVTFFNKKMGFSIGTLNKIYRYLNSFQPDIIHTHLTACLYGIPWALFHNVRIVHTIHSEPKHEMPLSVRYIMQFLYKHNKAIPVAISEIIAKQTALLYCLPTEQIEIVYNPVNSKIYTPIKDKLPGDNIVFVNVARFTKIKNQKGLVEAFRMVKNQIPSTHLLLIGDGPMRLEVEERTKELGLEEAVTFTGIITDISNALMKSDIFVLPSYYEGLPLTVLEAMAAGLPIIATAVGGVPDVVKDNGILVGEGDIEELTKAMINLAKDRTLRNIMSKIALEEVKKYDISEVAKQYEKLYDRYTRY